jgi:hypothetical protein
MTLLRQKCSGFPQRVKAAITTCTVLDRIRAGSLTKGAQLLRSGSCIFSNVQRRERREVAQLPEVLSVSY